MVLCSRSSMKDTKIYVNGGACMKSSQGEFLIVQVVRKYPETLTWNNGYRMFV